MRPLTDTDPIVLALAEAMHDVSDLCNANYQCLFQSCEMREADIADAIEVTDQLRRRGWQIVADPAGTVGAFG